MPFFGTPVALGLGLASMAFRPKPWYFRAAGQLRSNIPQYAGGAMMGLGYTSGAYTGYGVSNTVDPIGIHRSKSYKGNKIHLNRMAYGMSGYGRYRYRRYSRFRRYRRYRRRSYYRRRYY
jgi:hypothetical protein